MTGRTLMNAATERTVCAGSALIADVPNGPPRQFWAVILGVFVAEVLAIAIFYASEWTWLRALNVELVHIALNGLGCSLEAAKHSLSLPGRVFLISPDCTYVDLIICSFPLLWRVRRCWIENCGVLVVFAVAVFAINLPRLVLAVYVTANGGSLFWSHDIIDYLLWYPTLGLILFSWARSLKTFWKTDAPKE